MFLALGDVDHSMSDFDMSSHYVIDDDLQTKDVAHTPRNTYIKRRHKPPKVGMAHAETSNEAVGLGAFGFGSHPAWDEPKLQTARWQTGHAERLERTTSVHVQHVHLIL